MISLEVAKQLLRIDYAEEDSELQDLINETKEYIITATNPLVDIESPLFNRCQKMLITHWFKNRGITTKEDRRLPLGIQSIFVKLAYSYDYVESGEV